MNNNHTEENNSLFLTPATYEKPCLVEICSYDIACGKSGEGDGQEQLGEQDQIEGF